MRWHAAESFRGQIAVIALASVSLVALAIVLVADIIASTEQTLVRDAQQQCATAANELAQQYIERGHARNEPLEDLPPAAEDLSLRGLTATVLRFYDAVTGGFYLLPAGRPIGAATSTGAGEVIIDKAERRLVQTAAERSAKEQRPVFESLTADRDIIVAAARWLAPGAPVAWTLKRLDGVHSPVYRRRFWLAALVLSALAGLGGVVSISIRLRRGVEVITAGVSRLETDFAYRMPSIPGQFGTIAQSINRMAERRATLESELRRQDRLAALGKVVAGVAHEIRNPLNSIRLSLELLQRRARRGAASGDEVGGALAEVDRLDRILARLLALGRPGTYRRELQDARPLLERAVKMVRPQAQEKRVDVVLECPQRLEAKVDGLEIEQVLINLLLNAVEASPAGAAVRVEAAGENGAIRVAVHDDGPGIPEAVRDHIFDPYFTTKENGNGLGLAVSREVAVRHGGSLSFSQDGKGTTFTFQLPVPGSGS